MISTCPMRLLAALSLLATSSGCAYFVADRKLDMQPFAENTVTAIGEMRRIETPPVWIRLRPFYSHPAVVAVREEVRPLRALMRGVNAYSLQVVSLNDARVSDPTKSRELARFLHDASQQALLDQADDAEIALTPGRREGLLKDIGAKERYLDALVAADPIVNAVLARGLDLADRIDAAILKAVNAVEVEIQGQYRPLLANRAAMLILQERAHQAIVWAEALTFGDAAAADRLREGVPLVAQHLPPGRLPNAKEQAAIVAALGAQADRVKAALDEMEPQYQAYRESVLELDQLRAKTAENVKLTRSVLMLWARSHKALAQGIEVPPMFDLAKIVNDNAMSAAKSVSVSPF